LLNIPKTVISMTITPLTKCAATIPSPAGKRQDEGVKIPCKRIHEWLKTPAHRCPSPYIKGKRNLDGKIDVALCRGACKGHAITLHIYLDDMNTM
jgi:hypothetical protein